MGSAGDADEGWSSSETGPTFGRMLGCAISFHTLGLSVWPTCDRILLMAAGRFEEPKDEVTELVTEDEDEVVIGNTPSSEPPPVEPVTPIATDEYDGDPLTTLAVLLEFFLDTSAGVSGNNCRLAGVGGLTTPELEVTFAAPPEVFLTDAEATGTALECELAAATCTAASGAFLLVLDAVCVVVAQRAVLGMWVDEVTVLFAVVQLTDVVTCATGALLVDGQELDKL